MIERPLASLRANALEPTGIGGEAIDRLVDGIKPDSDVMLAVDRHHRQRYAVVIEIDVEGGAAGRHRLPETEAVPLQRAARTAVEAIDQLEERAPHSRPSSANEILIRIAERCGRNHVAAKARDRLAPLQSLVIGTREAMAGLAPH